MTRPALHQHTGSADDAWLEAMLRAAKPPAIDDAGFCAAVLARVAAYPAVLAPTAALAAMRHAENRERASRHWTIAGTLVGALVAGLVASHGPAGAIDPGAILLPALALIAATSLAWLAISRS